MIHSNHTSYYRDDRYHHQTEDRPPMDQHQSHVLSAKQNPLYRDSNPHPEQHRRQHSYAEQQQQQQQHHHHHHHQHQQQQQHHQPQQQQQQRQQQPPYHPSQPNHSIQTAAAAVRRQASLLTKGEDHHNSPNHHYAIPIVQSSDPSFAQRPHARSFSGTHQHPQYSHGPVPPPTATTTMHSQQGPRLHHSVSAGHLVPAGYRSAPLASSMPDPMGFKPRPAGAAAAAAPNVKKKDPYATAWRTYSKIAEELDLLNPDGSLYPISKEAILKYLRHQSKRIKSSNLHWYVNGLKKHQENLGFPWDDVRYDDQVVALLKELTLHPVTIVHGGSNNNGSINGNRAGAMVGEGVTYGQSADRQRQVSGNGVYPSGSGHHQHHQQQHPRIPSSSMTGSIDTAKIASLSISQQIIPPSQPYQGSYGSGSHRPLGGHSYEEKPSSVQMKQSHSSVIQRTQVYSPPTIKAASYHSAPIQLPSSHGQGDLLPSRIPTSQQSSPMSSSEIHIGTPLSTSAQSIEHKRQESGVERTVHLASPTSPSDGMEEDFDTLSRNMSHEDQDNYQPEYMDSEPTERVALKRYASTGTLRSQARASAISVHPYPRPSDHRQRDEQSATLSPRARENEPSGASLFFPVGSPDAALQSRMSPLGPAASIGSSSPASRNATGGPILSIPRHKRTNGVVSSPISTVAAVIASAATAATMSPSPVVPSKRTVQFSEVAEVAQQLQTKYGNRCKTHPWGCVEVSEDFHLELTIKMYMDWAGLVASGRLTMDELPDLPEFRVSDRAALSSSPPTTFVGGGTLKRMTSTPSNITMGSLHQQQQRTIMKSEELSPSPNDHGISRSYRYATFGGNGGVWKHRSPSRSPLYGSSPKEGYLIESLMSRIGSPPPTRFLPSPPATTVVTLPSNKDGEEEMSPRQKSSIPAAAVAGERGLANSVTRVRARRMASSPSLGQHHSHLHSYSDATSPTRLKQGNSYGMASPPLPSRPQFMPPAPSLPSSLLSVRSASGQLLAKNSGGYCRSQTGPGEGEEGGPGSLLSNSTASSPPSEDMEFSANEDEEGESVMMEDEDEGGAGHRGGSRPSAAAPSSSPPPRLHGNLHYEEDGDLVMASRGRDETRQGDEDERELDDGEGQKMQKEREGQKDGGEDRDRDKVHMGEQQGNWAHVPVNPLSNGRSSSSRSAQQTSNLHSGQQQQLHSGEEQQRKQQQQYRERPKDDNDNDNNAWPSRVQVEFDEGMVQGSEGEEGKRREDMHGSTPHPKNQHPHQQQPSRRNDNENYDHGQEDAEENENEEDEKREELDQRSWRPHQHDNNQQHHHRRHYSDDRDEDRVEEVRMEFKSLHSWAS